MRSLERHVAGLAPTLLERVTHRLVQDEPATNAVVVTGSYAKGTADAASDLDVTAITPTPRVPYRTWFEPRAPEPSLHVSAGASTADDWLAASAEPARWSLGFPAIVTAVYLWADDEARARLGNDPSVPHPAAPPELEDFVEAVVKAKRAAARDDEAGLRWLAQNAAALAPRLLVPLNDERVVRDRRDALDAALDLVTAPVRYRADIEVCFGVIEASGEDVRAAVTRLGSDLLAFLREHDPTVDPQPEIARYLADGTLERHLDRIA